MNKFNRGEAEVTRIEQERLQDSLARISTRRTASFINVLFSLLTGLCFLFNSFPAYGSGGDIVWQSGDAKAGKQESTASVTDASGDVIVTGYQNIVGDTNDDYYTAKFNGNGSGVIWAVPYDKAGGSDVATAIAVDSNGDIIVTGHVSNGLNSDIHTIKYSGASGTVLWQHTYNGTSNGNDYGVSVAVDSLNNIYVAGYSQTTSNADDFIVIKYDSVYSEYPSVSVTPLWTEIFGSTGQDRATSIIAGIDGIAVTGYSWNGSNFDYLTRKYGFDKTLIWEKAYAGTASGDDRGLFIKMDAAGNVIVTGYSANSSNHDIYTVKYNGATGTIAWEKTYDGTDEDEPTGLYVFSTGDVYVTGFTRTLTSRYYFYTVRYSGSTGTEIWAKTFNSGGDNDDIPTAIVADEAGDIFVTGYTFKTLTSERDFQTIKYREEDGIQLWQFGFDGAAHKDDRPVGIVLSPTGEPIVVGWSDKWTSGASDYDYYVIKYDPGLLNAPAGLTATAITNTEVSLSWTDNSDAPNNEEGFDIWRKLGETGTYVNIGSVGPDVTVYSDTAGLVADNYYYYKVRALNSTSGNSHFSNEAHVLTRVVSYDAADWSFIYNNSPDNGDDIAKGIAVGPDDDPVVTGYSFSEIGTFDYYTVKLDRADASVLWSERYDDPDSEQDDANCIAVDNDNNVIVSGFSSLYGGGEMNTNDIYTIKYPSVGSPEIWHDQYNGPAGGDDRATAIAARTDGSGNVAVVGYGHNASDNDDIYALKYAKTPSFDEYGNAIPMWTAIPYDSGGNDYSTAVAFDSAGNVFVTGYSSNGSNYDCFIAKYDTTTGSRIWTDIYNGAGGGNDRVEAVAVDSSDNVYITGYGVNAAGNEDFYTIKYNGATGAKIWGKAYDGPGHGNDEAVSVRLDPVDGAVIVAGTSLTSAGNNDFHIIRYSADDGSIIWERNFERDDNDDYAMAMEVDASGYIYVAGNTNNGVNSDILSVIYDYEGNYLDAVLFNGTANSDDYASSLTVNYQGEAFIAGYSRNASGNADYVVLKQKHDFILIPAPLTLTPQADYSIMKLDWRDNSPGTSFRIERTPAPSTPSSTWTPIYTAPPGTISYQDTGLNYGSGYCYRIDAFIGSLSSRKVEACSITTLHSPVWNSVTAVSTTQINLSWQNVSGNTGYKIERKEGAGAWGDLTVLGAGVNTYSDTGLTAGTTYTYRVSTLSASGYSLPNAEQSAITLCSAPALNNPTGNSISGMSLSWGSVMGAANYTVQYKISGGIYADYGPCTGITATSCSVTGLDSGKQYYFQVKATNSSGDSAWSNEVNGFTLPTAPTVSSVTRPACSSGGNGNTTATISWGDVSDETAYYLQYAYCTQSSSNPNNCATTSGYWSGWTGSTRPAQDVTQTTFSMTAGYAYRFRVYATVNNGSTYSAASNEGPIWACMAPLTQNAIQPASSTSLTVSWGNINGNNNYDVQRQICTGTCNGDTCVGGGYTTVGTASYNDTSFTDQLLTEGASYSYKIRAYNTTNFANMPAPPEVWSNERCLATPPPAPDPVTLSNVTASQITLDWQDNGSGQYNGYVIERSQNTNDNPGTDTNPGYWGGWSTISGTTADPDFENASTSWTGTVGTTAGTSFDTSVFYSGAKSLKIYQSPTGNTATIGRYQNVAVMKGGQYVLSGWLNASLTQGAVQCDVFGSGIDSPGIRISSGDVNNNAGWVYLTETVTVPSNITSVSIRCFGDFTPRGTAYFDMVQFFADPAVTTCTDTGLTAGRGYKYRVKAGYGSDLYTAYTAEKYTRTVPATPSISSLTPNSTTQITAAWNNVTGNTGYRLDWKEKTDTDCTAGTYTTVNLGQTTYSYAKTGLTEGMTYCFRVMAYNGSGDSAYSATSTRMTLLSPPTLNNPGGFTTTSVGLSWSSVTGNSGYKIERKTGAGGTYAQLATTGTDEETYTDTGLTPGEQYYYRLYTKNSENYYSTTASNEKSARTTPAQPVVALTVPSTSQVTLSWPVVYGATNYKIERKTGPTGTYEQIADQAVTYQELYCNQTYPYVGCTTLSPATTTYDDAGLDEGAVYCYQIKAYNSADNRDSATSAEQCTSTSDLAKPVLTGSALNSMNIELTWSYNGSSPIDGAEIEVKMTGVWVLMTTTDVSTHTIVDRTGINPNTRYSYRARVYKTSGEKSEYSDEFSIVTPPYVQGNNTCN